MIRATNLMKLASLTRRYHNYGQAAQAICTISLFHLPFPASRDELKDAITLAR